MLRYNSHEIQNSKKFLLEEIQRLYIRKHQCLENQKGIFNRDSICEQ
jgi:hypothetical protein